MKAFLKRLGRTFSASITYLWILGPIVFIIFKLSVDFFAPEGVSRIPWWQALLPLAVFMLGCIPSNHLLLNGRIGLKRWSDYVLVATLPIAATFGLISGHGKGLYPFGDIFVAVGVVPLIGLFSGWRFLAIGIVYTVSFVCGALLWQSDYLQANVFVMTWSKTLVFFFLWAFGGQSRFASQRDTAIRELLRNARKDKRTIAEERRKSDRLLLNILPEAVASELKETGTTRPVHYESASVLFTDFQGFTAIAESLPPGELISELDRCFSFFDQVCARYKLEKLKTIGDSYMCAGGLPKPNRTHAVDCVLAALEMQRFMRQMREIKQEQGLPYWEIRLGIHSGPLIAGVVGENKFAYDVWGDTVNTASRLESSGAAGEVNISFDTWRLVSDFFVCEPRGKVTAKHKGEIDMYFARSIRPELSDDKHGTVPGAAFHQLYAELEQQEELFPSP